MAVLKLQNSAFASIARRLIDGTFELSKREVLLTGKASRRCEHPVKFTVRNADIPLMLGIKVSFRCRKCDACMRNRRVEWAYRGHKETRRSPRTWFVTVTLKPENMAWVLSTAKADRELATRKYEQDVKLFFDARENERRYGVVCELKHPRPVRSEFDFQASAANRLLRNQFRALRQGGWYTKDGKRMQHAPTKFRYLVVWEKHTGDGIYRGLPHAHMLLHEDPNSPPVKKGWIEATLGKCGHVKPRLVASVVKAAWYCVKYLTKVDEAKILASPNYGSLVNE